MIKTILVPVTGTDADSGVFAAALHVARFFGAHLDFLHVRLDPGEIAASLATDFSGGAAPALLIERLEEDAAQRAEKAQKSVQAFCEREKLVVGTAASDPETVSAQWHQESGNEAAWIAEYGRTSDLLMGGRSAENGGTGRAILEAALLDTGRPLLIPGPAPMTPETIAIAWKSTREAAHAVTAASPFLAKAKRIVILTVPEDGRTDREAGTRLFATLHRHNPATEARHLQPGPRGAAETLLAAAAEIGAGLLVMGGYGHSRMRELIFGGVTEHVLRTAALPVLMAH